MDISVVIPAYNEENRIGGTLKEINRFCKDRFANYEIIVVDDCSRDKTGEVVSSVGDNNIRILRNSVNRGKGFSVKRGILSARYPLVLFSDSDLATPITELPKFLDIAKKNDIVIASRNCPESEIVVGQPFYRRFMGKIFPLFVNSLVVGGFKDTQCGFKLFRTNAGKRIVRLQRMERFSFDVEILFIAGKMGYRVAEVPVRWVDKAGSKVSPIKDGTMMLVDLFRIRWNNLMGKYDPF